jgi:hypothetical protein
MDKVYGKSLLEQIKSEKLEEKNRLLKEEMERKKQIEADREKKKQQARMVANVVSNKGKVDKSEKPVELKHLSQPVKPLDLTVDMQRPAFVTAPFAAYRKNDSVKC